MSCLWIQSPDEMLHQKTLAKKAPILFGLQAGDLNISNIFYEIQYFNSWPVFLVITDWTYTCLSPWALGDFWSKTKQNNGEYEKRKGNAGFVWRCLERFPSSLACK